MAHFKSDENNSEIGLHNFKFSYLRCPTTHAYLEVSMNNDMYWTVTGHPKQTATCLTDRKSAVRAPKLLRDSSSQSS